MTSSSAFLAFLSLVFLIGIHFTSVNARNPSRHNKSKQITQKALHNRYSKYICLEDDNTIEKSSVSLGISCKCPSIRAPVCGSDNITYHNRCFMHCRAKHATTRYHRYRLTLKHFGECEVNSSDSRSDSSNTNPTNITSNQS